MDSTEFNATSFSSPLEQVFFRHVPKSHEKALRQAVYNVLALVAFGLMGFGAYYFAVVVLEPFVTPIFWALMTGFVIHPHKTKGSEFLKRILQPGAPPSNGRQSSSTFFSLGWRTVVLAEQAMDRAGGAVVSSWKAILFLGSLLFLSHLFLVAASVPAPVTAAIGAVSWALQYFLQTVENQLSWTEVVVLAVINLLVVLCFWSESRSALFQVVSSLTWLVVLTFLALRLWPPLLCFFPTVFIISWFIGGDVPDDGEDCTDGVNPRPSHQQEKLKARSKLQVAKNDGRDKNGRMRKNSLRETVYSVLRIFNATAGDIDGEVCEDSNEAKADCETSEECAATSEEPADETVDKTRQTEEEPDGVSFQEDRVKEDCDPLLPHRVAIDGAKGLVMEHPGVSALKRRPGGALGGASTSTPVSSSSVFRPQGVPTQQHMSHGQLSGLSGSRLVFITPTGRLNANRTATIIRRRPATDATFLGRSRAVDREGSVTKESTIYLHGVMWSCAVLQLWFHPTLLHLLPIPISYYFLKRIVIKLELLETVTSLWRQLGWVSQIQSFLGNRYDALLPRPVMFAMEELLRCETRLVRCLPQYSDLIVTVVLIAACNLAIVVVLIFVGFQLYTESADIMLLTGTILKNLTNSTVYRSVNEILGSAGINNTVDGLDEFAHTAYRYGRDYIRSSMKQYSSEEGDLELIEAKVLELWDKMYQYWLHRDALTEVNDNVGGFNMSQTLEDLLATSKNGANGDLASSLSALAANNMGSVMYVVEQSWLIMKGNIGLVAAAITELVKFLFTGGSGMVSFALSAVIYFTALFYLLSSTEPIYKPIEVITNYGQLLGTGFAEALNKAINAVFTITVKMVTFYGLWTYLTHKIFAVCVVTVPVIAAAFLAAVPVAGQYVVAIPAALELSLVEGRHVSALLLIFCHVAPSYVVDAAIYSEVRQGIHPWITGLSIVGGVYWCGITGAVYGPLLLCAVYVILTMYTGVLREIPLEAATTLGKSKLQTQHHTSYSQAGLPNASRGFTPTPLLKRSDSVI